MAAVAATADIMIEKDSEILVRVEEALADLIVVSYCTDDKKFQGVLLDANKGTLPFGVYSLHPAFNKDNPLSNKDEKLHSVSQRFTYQEPQYATEKPQTKKVSAKGKAQPRQKMTVRLRPRKVLCSNCQGICNENNENVHVKKRKLDGSASDDAPFEAMGRDAEKKFLMGSMLIPKLSRLQPQEISDAIKGNKNCDESDREIEGRGESCDNDRVPHEVAFVNVNEDINMNCDIKTDTAKQDNDAPFNSIFTNKKTIKICFGEGEGTVVKIPALVGDYNEDSGVCDMTKQSELKAAKKALKKAKRQAKKNSALGVRTGLSPKHIGALSPRNNMDTAPCTLSIDKKHKHKVKHKKKNKERDENTSKGPESEPINYFSDIKGNCNKQKPAVNLRRPSSHTPEEKGEESGSEGWESDAVPDFPEDSTEGVGGKHLPVTPGDIVWGKVVGFPWWPGRVLSVSLESKAHVAWFASKTSSMIPCDSLSPFLEDYKVRFNKKKRGPYKEAVKQATIEAKQLLSHIVDPLGSPSHSLPTVSPRPINVFS
ncbi:unnamed protein product [Plutella xylostella]|uniref:(diamondback moth) hypothetical protein n=1 Tax=Plutella xylostella TaxID=51655 RepID=A0A8S4FWD5_PLUXY|nr:unnamed protein product [Plutella xylostella]